MVAYYIFIAYVSWGEGGKLRPVLVLGQSDVGVVVFNITTAYAAKSEIVRSNYFEIGDWQQAGLKQQSYIDTNKTTTLPKSSIKYPLGKLTPKDAQRLFEFLKKGVY